MVQYSPQYGLYVANKSITPSSDTAYTSNVYSVAMQILFKFGIPVTGSAGGGLDGYDINNQDAASMMKLSLAENMPGKFYEVYVNENGLAEFVDIGEQFSGIMDVRYVVESGRKEVVADLVIVRGYDPPPKREMRDEFNAFEDAEIFDYSLCVADTCQAQLMKRHASIVYRDPFLDQSFKDDVRNAYELQAFETIIGYLVKFTAPPRSSYPNARISLSGTCKQPVSLGSFSGSSDVRQIVSQSQDTEGCSYDITEKVYGQKIELGEFYYTDLHGERISDFQSVADVLMVGQKVIEIHDFRALSLLPGGRPYVYVEVEKQKQSFSLSYGKDFIFESDLEGKASLTFFYRPTVIAGFGEGQDLQELYRGAAHTTVVEIYTPGRLLGTGEIVSNNLMDGVGDGLGYNVYSICAFVERRKPSVDIFEAMGEASAAAAETFMTYTPVVIIDEPSPIAFAAKTSIPDLGRSGVIDQSLDIVDNDPTTLQDFEHTPSSLLQDYSNGSVIDITLPFATETLCLEIADRILDLQNEIVDTKTYICGPTSNPRLGHMYNGQIINSIDESFSDSSSYTITVNTGPKTLNVGSWGDSKWLRKTEDVTREGTITQIKGDGATYIVKVKGLGTYEAISFVPQILYVNDKVQVRIYNHPTEA